MARALTLVVLTLLVAPLAPGVATAAEPYRVGPGDVLEVAVHGRPDLSRLPTVQTTGGVYLPRASYVEVAGLTTSEIEGCITPLLGLP